MQTPDTAKPATAPHGEPASNCEHLGRKLSDSHTPNIVAAQLVGSDSAVVNNISARGALDLCRHLLGAGVDPDAELRCYRDGQRALRVSSIGYGAGIVVRETATEGPRFATWRPFPAARSARPFGETAMPSIPSVQCANAPVQA